MLFLESVIYHVRGTRNPKVFVENYSYSLQRRSNTKSRWRCLFVNKTRCRAFLNTYGNNVKVINHHNHDPPKMPSTHLLISQNVVISRGFVFKEHSFNDRFKCVIFISSGRKYPKLVLDDYHYCLLSQAKEHTKWRCLFYYKTKCKAGLSTSKNVVTVLYGHNHPAVKTKELMITFAMGVKNKPFILINDFKYLKHRSSQNSTYWKCCYYDTGTCKARCTTYEGCKIKISGIHNHYYRPIFDLKIICQKVYDVIP
ncbi:unnamed protein product [Phyllotreta striolata]|uniref:FLYWCH-type domain-containing protein n=1 Tax=Phyllotreta striolata TaxID=444603 RepID=A0A9N9TJL5_PHYSR|nr:unnamed protein product [Phyllotreta striolata]